MVLFPRCERFVPLEEKQIALLPMLFNGKDKLTQVRFLSLSSINEPGAVRLLCPLKPGEDNLRPLIIPLSDCVMQQHCAYVCGAVPEREKTRAAVNLSTAAAAAASVSETFVCREPFTTAARRRTKEGPEAGQSTNSEDRLCSRDLRPNYGPGPGAPLEQRKLY